MNNHLLENQHALIVGGGTGIGRAIAEGLAAAGCKTAIAGRRKEKLDTVCQGYAGVGAILCHEADVADRESLRELVTWFNQKIGTVDIFVNAAGINIKNRTMAAMQPEQFDQVMAVNATGAYNGLLAVLPQMRQQQRGTVINISSIAGKRAIDLGGIAYCASKFAMTALGTAVGQEEAAHGIRITNVYPGEVDTPLLEQRPNPVADDHRARMLQPEDVAEIVIAICRLPMRVHIPEIVVKPRLQAYF